jgi:DNA-binding NtrC family response regulator
MDGREALVELESQSFDLVVTDYQMLGMNGLELAEILGRRRPGMPVILMTGHSTRELQKQARGLGVFCVLEKPVPVHLFLRAVRAASERDSHD